MHKLPPLWLFFFIASISQSSETIFASALTDLADNLSLSINLAQLCSAVYLCGFTIGVFSLGRLSDLFGRKKIIIFGTIVYFIFSFLISISSSVYLLFVFRFFQAIGVSACSVLPQAIARDCYSGRDLAKIYGMISFAICLVPTFASSIGGFVVEHFSWRENVQLMCILALCALAACVFFLPETLHLRQIDRTISFRRIAIIMLKDPKVLSYAVISGISIGMLSSFIIEFSVTFIKLLGIRPSIYGMLNIVITLSMLIGNALNIFLNAKFISPQTIIHYGTLMSVIGCSIILFAGVYSFYFSDFTKLLAALLLIGRMAQGLGHIIMMPSILSLALTRYKQFTGSATALFNSSYYFVITIISCLTSYLHSDTDLLKFSIMIFFLSCINYILFARLKNL